jgi:hypothetical protein
VSKRLCVSKMVSSEMVGTLETKMKEMNHCSSTCRWYQFIFMPQKNIVVPLLIPRPLNFKHSISLTFGGGNGEEGDDQMSLVSAANTGRTDFTQFTSCTNPIFDPVHREWRSNCFFIENCLRRKIFFQLIKLKIIFSYRFLAIFLKPQIKIKQILMLRPGPSSSSFLLEIFKKVIY